MSLRVSKHKRVKRDGKYWGPLQMRRTCLKASFKGLKVAEEDESVWLRSALSGRQVTLRGLVLHHGVTHFNSGRGFSFFLLLRARPLPPGESNPSFKKLLKILITSRQQKPAGFGHTFMFVVLLWTTMSPKIWLQSLNIFQLHCQFYSPDFNLEWWSFDASVKHETSKRKITQIICSCSWYLQRNRSSSISA